MAKRVGVRTHRRIFTIQYALLGKRRKRGKREKRRRGSSPTRLGP
jgi:hypothetical protein